MSESDIFPIVQYLTKKLFPFNYVIPAQSINSIFHFKRYCQRSEHLKKFLSEMQAGADEDYTPSDNVFTADNYRVIHFVVDMPVRLPRKLLERAPSTAWALGPVVFVICEFQVIDRETEARNEQGDASHAKYKERQKKAVMRRLQVGMRELKTPARRTEEVRRSEEPAPISRRTVPPPRVEVEERETRSRRPPRR